MLLSYILISDLNNQEAHTYGASLVSTLASFSVMHFLVPAFAHIINANECVVDVDVVLDLVVEHWTRRLSTGWSKQC